MQRHLLTATCRACATDVGDDQEICARCHALLTPWRAGAQSPLVLPGTRGLSADDVRRPTLPMSAIGGIVLGVAVATTALTTMPERGQDSGPANRIAIAAPRQAMSNAATVVATIDRTVDVTVDSVIVVASPSVGGNADAPVARRVNSTVDVPVEYAVLRQARSTATRAVPRAVPRGVREVVRPIAGGATTTVAPSLTAAPTRGTVSTLPPTIRSNESAAAVPASSTVVVLPGAADAVAAAATLADAIRRGAVNDPALRVFVADGATHRATVVAEPVIIAQSASGVTIAFDVRMTKFDGGGRPVTRLASITMKLSRENGAVHASAPRVGDVRKP